jgi:hypothetical protein
MMRQDQIDALDEIIAAIERGELTMEDVHRELYAPVNNKQRQHGGFVTQTKRAVTATITTTIGVTLTIVGGVAVRGEHGLSGETKVPERLTLDALLEARRRAVAE